MSNIGKYWSKEEETQLLEELERNEDIKIIADNHGRNTGGIVARQKKIARCLHNDGNDLEEISRITRLSYEQLNKILKTGEKSLKDIILLLNEITDILKEMTRN